MISFGHAAYFGLGAYGAGLLVEHLAAPMELALPAAPLLALTGGMLFGWFCVRLAGVYMAMLSLAFAQIVHAVVFQWYDVTGGDNGLVGIWPSGWASPAWVYYYLTLAMTLISLTLLRHIVVSPFGSTLRACRDSPARAEAIGIDVTRQRWLAFALAGAFAGLAGGMLAFLKGTIDPTWLAVSQSVEALVMVLLGGVHTLTGPIVGAAAYHGLEIWFSTLTRFWPLVLGLIIVALVLAFPQGVVGYLARRIPRAEGL
jgi:branched-chain amino acid transport system permease protein